MAKLPRDKDVKGMTLKELCLEYVETGKLLKDGNLSSWLAQRKETRRVSIAMEIANRTVNK